jgi:hypothetical protein
LALQLASCGTLLYPERRGQPAGRLDPAVVILDAAGLILFFIPGVIAFAVDFADGAIYLPPDHTTYLKPPAAEQLQRVQGGTGHLTPQRIEAVVQEQTGQRVRLAPGQYQAMKLGDISEFTPNTLERMQADGANGTVDFPSRPN